jgi:SpoVK/Ycf46/Vps4 family AAA+-type ATPase
MDSALPPHDLRDDLRLLVNSRYPLIAAETAEEDRLEEMLAAIAGELNVPLLVWSVTTGLCRRGIPGAIYGTDDPEKALANLEAMHGDGIYLLKDFTRYLQQDKVLRRLRELAAEFKTARRAIVMCSPSLDIPHEVETDVVQFHLALPDAAALLPVVQEIIADLGKQAALKNDLDPAGIRQLAQNLCGLTLEEARRTLRKCLMDNRRVGMDTVAAVLEAKRASLPQDGLLEFVKPDSSFADVAGLVTLRDWLDKRRDALTPEGQKFGLEPPKGLLITGVQGCGKSLCAKAVAGEWQMQLARFDAGALYDKYVGESEKRLKKTLELAEKLAPVILWMDEIEKAFASGSAGSDADAGLSQRILGTFLTWLQDRPGGVFITATSNDISRLPPELLRKGRFDEIFFVDLPDAAARADLFRIHLKRRGREAGQFDLAALAVASEGFSGAEIEQVIVAGLYTAFSKKIPLSTQVLSAEIAATRPLSVTRREDIESIRAWAHGRAVPAN